ncbi:MAG: FixH family protein [Minicystis sp.]
MLRTIACGSLLLASAVAACSSSSGGGGPVSGPADAHCGTTVTVTDPAVCKATGTAPEEEEHATLFNAEGDDDECKYHVKWTATDIGENEDVTFTVTMTSKADGTPVTGADPNIEAFLTETHPAPNSDAKTTETGAGVYTIGPIRFDAAGQWTVRFHFFEECTEIDEATPHSHVAFFVSVP